MRNVGNLNDEGSICFLTDPDSFTTQEGVCPSHTVGALRRGDGTSWGAHAPPAVCHVVVTAESGGGPAPGLCGSLTRLFPRYVQEVIQRGRSCVRPACTPVLSVVPAVSDTELSETEYVRPLRVFSYCSPSLCCGPGDLEQQLFRGRGARALHWKSWCCKLFADLSFLSLSKETLTIHMVTNNQ